MSAAAAAAAPAVEPDLLTAVGSLLQPAVAPTAEAAASVVRVSSPPAPAVDPAPAATSPVSAMVVPEELVSILACIRAHESTNNYQAKNGIYRGAYQFDGSTWQSVGGSGDPVDAPPEEQDYRASLLYQKRGIQPWPNARC